MKRIALLGAAMLLSISMTSCIPGHELNETAIVQAVGIDWAEDGYEITMQIYAPKGGGATTAIDTSNNNANILTAKGRTIGEAMNNATALQGEFILTGHNRLLIFGETLAREGVESLFSYFDRNHLTRQSIDVLVAKGDARDILSANIDQGILAAETLERVVENCELNGFIARNPYYLFSRDMYLYEGSSAVPVIELVNPGGSSGPGESSQPESGPSSSPEEEIQTIDVVQVEKTAVFRDYRMVDILEKEESQGYVFLSNNIDSTTLVAEDDDGRLASVNIYDCSSDLKPEFSGEEITFRLTVRAKASIDEVLLPKGENVGLEQLESFSESAEREISGRCTDAFQQAIREDRCNLLYLEDLVHKKNPELWKQIGDGFSDSLQNLKLETDVSVEITRLSVEANQNEK